VGGESWRRVSGSGRQLRDVSRYLKRCRATAVHTQKADWQGKDFGRPCGTHREWERVPGIEMPGYCRIVPLGRRVAFDLNVKVLFDNI